MEFHCTEPFIITLPLSPNDLNNVEKDINTKLSLVSYTLEHGTREKSGPSCSKHR